MKRIRTILACWKIDLAAARVELRRWNKRRALVCGHGCDFRPRRPRADVAAFVAALHERDYPGHAVRVKRFG